jgi:hypothetical protein
VTFFGAVPGFVVFVIAAVSLEIVLELLRLELAAACGSKGGGVA